jgi:hypothetical protein
MHRRNINDEGYGSEGSGETLAFVWARGELGESTYRYLRLSQRKKTPDVPKHSKDDQADRCCFDDQTGRLLSLVNLRTDGKETSRLCCDSPPCRFESARPSHSRTATRILVRKLARSATSSRGSPFRNSQESPHLQVHEDALRTLAMEQSRTPRDDPPTGSSGLACGSRNGCRR